MEDVIAIACRLIEYEKFNQACALLTEAIQQTPGSPELYDTRAVAFNRMLKNKEAIQDLNKALELDSKFHLAYTHLAEIFILQDNTEEAIYYIEKAREIVPENMYYTVLHASLLNRSKRFTESLALCNKVLNMDPANIDCLQYRAEAYGGMNLYEAAAKDYEAACSVNMNDVVLLNNTGYYYSKCGNISRAKNYLELAIQKDPRFSYPYDNLGYVYMLEKNYTKAHQLIDYSIELDPANSYAYKNRALVYLKQGENQKAKIDLEKAKELLFDLYYGDEVNELLDMLK